MEHKFKEKNKSIWSMTTHLPPRDPLPGNLTVEAAVIGAGMAGILTAYLLQKQGVDVVVLEADQVASGQTKNTTAKITSQHGIIYHDLIKKLGKQKAAAYALANEAAVRAYGEIVAEEKIECDFERLPSYLYTTQPSMTAKLEQEAKAASALGIPAHFTQIHGLPFETVGAVCFEGQAQFHPLAFIKHLSQKVTVYEGTRVLKVKKHMIFTDRGTVNAGHVIFASHYPFLNLPGMFFARQHQDRSYVLCLDHPDKLDGMFYSVDKDGLSLRWIPGALLLGGSSHRTGKNTAGGEYQRLKKAAKQYYPDSRIIARWSAQDCMPHDDIPFIGRYSVFRPYWYVATGFKKWGMTSSMLSAMIIRDLICGLESPYAKLFCPQRFHIRASLPSLLADLGESMVSLTKGAFHLPLRAVDLKEGHGGIIRIGLKRYACYKDEKGILHKTSARCPHLGCELKWNPAERTWDCPCHGSRFDYDGNLIDNPAQKGNAF